MEELHLTAPMLYATMASRDLRANRKSLRGLPAHQQRALTGRCHPRHQMHSAPSPAALWLTLPHLCRGPGQRAH